jgi:hypothetical protein
MSIPQLITKLENNLTPTTRMLEVFTPFLPEQAESSFVDIHRHTMKGWTGYITNCDE